MRRCAPRQQGLLHQLHDGFPARPFNKNILWRLADKFFPAGIGFYFHQGFFQGCQAFEVSDPEHFFNGAEDPGENLETGAAVDFFGQCCCGFGKPDRFPGEAGWARE